MFDDYSEKKSSKRVKQKIQYLDNPLKIYNNHGSGAKIIKNYNSIDIIYKERIYNLIVYDLNASAGI